MTRVREFWNQLGGKLGIVLCLAGFVGLFLGWNGAASHDRVPAQFPYLISGGLVGLALVIIGVGMIVVETGRRGRDEVIAALADLRVAMESGVGGVQTAVLNSANGDGTVVAGASSYHRPECHLVQGRDSSRLLTVTAANEEGLSPCRICNPVVLSYS